jgi:hypothetical protein
VVTFLLLLLLLLLWLLLWLLVSCLRLVMLAGHSDCR